MKLRFRQLQAFHAIIQTGTVVGAAEMLGISQPGVSNLISQLERQTGLKLFERMHGRLTATPEAAIIHRNVDAIVRGLQQVTQTVVDLQNKQTGNLQIASQHSMSFGVMPRIIGDFKKIYPDISISFQSQYSAKIQEWVEAGIFEIGICELPKLYDTLTYYPIQIPTKIVMHHENPLGEHQVLTPELLRHENFILMGPDHTTQTQLFQAFEQAGVKLKSSIHSHLFKNLLSFVKEDMGVALVDDFAIENDLDPRFISRDFTPKIYTNMAIITSNTRPLSQLANEFLQLLRQKLACYFPKAETKAPDTTESKLYKD
jgi:DNA-binding transcriptional LysR family regulator